MSSGSNKVTLDSKGRFAIPTRFRPGIAEECKNRMYITRGPRRELWLLTEPNWEVLYAKVDQLAVGNGFRNRIMKNGEPVEIDGNGRLLIPSGLREKGLLPNPTLALLGAGKHFEIWDWDEHMAQEESESDEAVETAAEFNY